MKIKNTAKGGRGLGVDGVCVDWLPGETKDVEDAIVAKAKQDPASAAMFDCGDLVVVDEKPKGQRVSVNDTDDEAAKQAATDKPAEVTKDKGPKK